MYSVFFSGYEKKDGEGKLALSPLLTCGLLQWGQRFRMVTPSSFPHVKKVCFQPDNNLPVRLIYSKTLGHKFFSFCDSN
jgi:hypothetical protein